MSASLFDTSDNSDAAFSLYLLHVTALSVTIGWLYWKTGGSLLLVMLMHASVNNTLILAPAAALPGASAFGFGGSLVAWITAGLAWVVAAPLLFLMRGARIQPR